MDQRKLKIEPFLHFDDERIYNPIADQELLPSNPLFERLQLFRSGSQANLERSTLKLLKEDKWIIDQDTDVLSRYLLKAVTLEATAHCNQRCKFCPVSINPKDVNTMSLPFYELIVEQLSEFSATIQGVFMINYNEPTLDRNFIERIKLLKKYNLPVCINTNGTGLTPNKVDQIQEMGGVRFLSINLSSLDSSYYASERKYTQLNGVLKNLDYVKNVDLAEEMVIAVLGENDDTHRKNHEEISSYFSGTHFKTKSFRINNRAGCLELGQAVSSPIANLAGCDLLGSRPLQHLLVNSYGQCVLCCQDYDEDHIIGDLREESIVDVLTGEKIKKLRAWTYGLEEAPADYLCRKCVFAKSCRDTPS